MWWGWIHLSHISSHECQHSLSWCINDLMSKRWTRWCKSFEKEKNGVKRIILSRPKNTFIPTKHTIFVFALISSVRLFYWNWWWYWSASMETHIFIISSNLPKSPVFFFFSHAINIYVNRQWFVCWCVCTTKIHYSILK